MSLADYSLSRELLAQRGEIKEQLTIMRDAYQRQITELQQKIDAEDVIIENAKLRVLAHIKKQDTFLAVVDHLTQSIKDYD